MPRRIVFLDVDGVLNSAAWTARRGDVQWVSREQRGVQLIDPDAVARLDRLVEAAQAEVVLASAWRKFGVEAMARLLELRGFRGRLIDRTPLPDEHDLELFRRLRAEPGPDPRIWPRGYELQQWLDGQAEIESIVILDDSMTMRHLEPWQIQTSVVEGLVDRHVEQALEILRRPAPKRSRADTRPPLRRPSSSHPPIIFLDVNGVLNSTGWVGRRGDADVRDMTTEQRRLSRIDPDAVARLNRLISATGAEVVLASSWRRIGCEAVARLLEMRGFRGRLIDRTPLPNEHDLELFRRLRGEPGPNPGPWPRGYELQQWLDRWPEIGSIVILDDSAIMEHLTPWQIRTSRLEGLVDEQVERALEILRQPGPPRSPIHREPDRSSQAAAPITAIPRVSPSLSRGRIIFLDVDGVLNSADWSSRRGDVDTWGMSREQHRLQRIDPDAVARLDRLVELARAEVVLSSSWRKFGYDVMARVLELRGFRGRLIDRTPLPNEHDLELFRRLHAKPGPDPNPWPRGYELQQWLDARPEVESIVILDDSASMAHLVPWHVRTSMADGLLDTHVEQALEILRRPGPPRSQVRELASSNTPEAIRWRGYVEAFDRWWRWIELGRAAEARGEFVEANACFAAGCWLQPESAELVVARTQRLRSPSLPERVRRQPDPDFPNRPAHARHRLAWELGQRGLDELPTLLRWSCDPNPKVRARIARSLGRIGHPAAIEALHEGGHDPDPDARAEAIAARRRIVASWNRESRGLASVESPDEYVELDPTTFESPLPPKSEFEARRALRFSGGGATDDRRARSSELLGDLG